MQVLHHGGQLPAPGQKSFLLLPPMPMQIRQGMALPKKGDVPQKAFSSHTTGTTTTLFPVPQGNNTQTNTNSGCSCENWSNKAHWCTL